MASVCDGCDKPRIGRTCDPITMIACGLSKERLVVFCGAGVSASKMPVASEFLKKFPGFENLSLSEATTVLRERTDFWHELKITFGGQDIQPTEAHLWLAHFGARHYVSTNYDLLLETALEKFAGREELAVVRANAELPLVSGRKTSCVKLHGDVAGQKPTDLFVLSERQYHNRIENPLRVDHFVSFLFATHAVLFVGYSLRDPNIVHLLEADAQLGDTFERFALFADEDIGQVERLRKLGVTPISLGVRINASSAERTAALNLRLRSIWEQTDALGDFLINLQERDAPVGEILASAIKDRKENHLERAQEGFEKLVERAEELEQQPKLLPRFLWLLVSLHDKTEQWVKLAALDRYVVNQRLLRALARISPEAVRLMVEAVYRGALAVANLRDLDFDSANANIKCALEWKPSPDARSEHHLLYANLLTARALVAYCIWRRSECKVAMALDQAQTWLDAAGTCYDQYAKEGQKDESHHLGRFYGTRALVALARTDSGSALALAARAHTAQSKNPAARSKFGRIAGQYCHALVLFEASRSQGHPDEQRYLDEAAGLVKDALAGVRGSQRMVQIKLKLLLAEIERASGALGPFDEPDLVTKDLLEKRGLTIGTWLTLPLN